MHELDLCICAIHSNFKRYAQWQDAHKASEGTLRTIASSPTILVEIINRNAGSKSLFESPLPGPDAPMPVYSSEQFTLQVNFFSPRPDLRTDTPFTTIHHHNNLALTTICISGAYHSFTFDSEVYDCCGNIQLRVAHDYVHRVGNCATIPPYCPHVVFAPSALTATLALWNRCANSAPSESLLKTQSGAIGSKLPFYLSEKWKLVDDHMFWLDTDILRFSPQQPIPLQSHHQVQNWFHKFQILEFRNTNLLRKTLSHCDETVRSSGLNLCDALEHGHPIPPSFAGFEIPLESSHPPLSSLLSCRAVSLD